MYVVAGRTGFIGWHAPTHSAWSARTFNTVDEAHDVARNVVGMRHYLIMKRVDGSDGPKMVLADEPDLVAAKQAGILGQSEELVNYLVNSYDDDQWDSTTKELLASLYQSFTGDVIVWGDQVE